MEVCRKGQRKHPKRVYRVTDRCATAEESIWFFHLVADFLARTCRQEKASSRHEPVQKEFNPSGFKNQVGSLRTSATHCVGIVEHVRLDF